MQVSGGTDLNRLRTEPTMRLLTVSCTTLALTLALNSAHADVTIVGKPQLGVFGSIQGAVDAAAQGDVIEVSDGIYASFVIHNKALTVMALPGDQVEVDGTCEVRALGPARVVSLIGLLATGVGLTAPEPGLRLVDNLGSVRLQGCTFLGSYTGGNGSTPPRAGTAAELARCSKVVFTRCMLLGRNMAYYSGLAGQPGGIGLDAVDSQIALYECVVSGGRGSTESYPTGGAGGDACRVSGWGLFASGTKIEGGRGGNADYFGCTTGGNGGNALVIEGASAKLYDTELVRGAAGSFYTCTQGMAGRRIVSTNALVDEFTSTHRSLGAPVASSDNAFITLNFVGEPGDSVEVLASTRSVFTYSAALSGVSTIPQPWAPVALGTIDASGTLSVPYFIADQTWPQAGRTVSFQAVITDAQQQRFFSTPIQVLVRNN